MQIHRRVYSAANSAETQTCKQDSLALELKGASTSVQFQCPEGSKLAPVEKVTQEEREGLELGKVYEFGPSPARQLTCGSGGEKVLEQLVPGSRLEQVAGAAGKEAVQQVQAASPVFKLTVGAAQDVEKHLCYVCTSPPQRDRGSPTPACTIFVTVPGKEAPDQPSDEPSRSFSLPVSSWLVLSVVGCALGWPVRV